MQTIILQKRSPRVSSSSQERNAFFSFELQLNYPLCFILYLLQHLKGFSTFLHGLGCLLQTICYFFHSQGKRSSEVAELVGQPELGDFWHPTLTSVQPPQRRFVQNRTLLLTNIATGSLKEPPSLSLCAHSLPRQRSLGRTKTSQKYSSSDNRARQPLRRPRSWSFSPVPRLRCLFHTERDGGFATVV